MERHLTELWYRPATRLSLLQPLAWVYGAVVRARRSAYSRGLLKAHSAGKPVVVIGNLTVGGTGKTPLTLWLIENLRARGLEPGVVARGYRRLGESAARRVPTPRVPARQGPRVVRADSRWEEVGDEPLLIHRRTGCPTVVSEDRLAAARRLAEEPVDVILSDDGLQHMRLKRDCEIALIDGARGLGNGRLLPAGPLRESASRLRQVDLIVVNGMAEHASLAYTPLPAARVLTMSLVAGLAHRLDGAGSPQPLEELRGGRIHAVAGIGNPDRFFRDLERRGLEVIRHPFPDHHPFAASDLAFPDERPILMTEKDAVRCAALATARMWYVPVTAQLGEADSQALLQLVCGRVDASQRSGALKQRSDAADRPTL